MRAAVPEAGGADGEAGEGGTGAFVGGAECEGGEDGEGALEGGAECEASEDGEGAFVDCAGFTVGVGLQASVADQWWCWCRLWEKSLFDRASA